MSVASEALTSARPGSPQQAYRSRRDDIEAAAADIGRRVDSTLSYNAAPVELDESLQPIDLAEVLDGEVMQPVPDMLVRDDGVGLFYVGHVNGIHGDSGIGKGWIECHVVAENARRGRRTMVIDFEDVPDSWMARLRAIGMDDDDIIRSFVYVRPTVPLTAEAVEHLCEIVRTRNVDAVALDSLGEAFGLEGVNEDKDVEVGPWLRRVARPLADTGAATILVDHSTKAADNPLHPSGSKRKRAAVTGASYLVEAVQPLAKGQGGRLRLTCAKDRHGTHRRGQVVADLVLSSGLSDSVRTTVYAPTVRPDMDEAGVVIELAARAAVDAAKREGKPLSRNALEGVMKIKARAETKRGGIDLAVTRGALHEERQGVVRLYTWITDDVAIAQ